MGELLHPATRASKSIAPTNATTFVISSLKALGKQRRTIGVVR
jgi:hypothetical protein